MVKLFEEIKFLKHLSLNGGDHNFFKKHRNYTLISYPLILLKKNKLATRLLEEKKKLISC